MIDEQNEHRPRPFSRQHRPAHLLWHGRTVRMKGKARTRSAVTGTSETEAFKSIEPFFALRRRRDGSIEKRCLGEHRFDYCALLK